VGYGTGENVSRSQDKRKKQSRRWCLIQNWNQALFMHWLESLQLLVKRALES